MRWRVIRIWEQRQRPWTKYHVRKVLLCRLMALVMENCMAITCSSSKRCNFYNARKRFMPIVSHAKGIFYPRYFRLFVIMAGNRITVNYKNNFKYTNSCSLKPKSCLCVPSLEFLGERWIYASMMAKMHQLMTCRTNWKV